MKRCSFMPMIILKFVTNSASESVNYTIGTFFYFPAFMICSAEEKISVFATDKKYEFLIQNQGIYVTSLDPH